MTTDDATSVMELTAELFRAFDPDDGDNSEDDTTMDLDFLVGVHDHLEEEAAEEAMLDDLEQLLTELDSVSKEAAYEGSNSCYVQTSDAKATSANRPNVEVMRLKLEKRPVDITRAICSICDEGILSYDSSGQQQLT